MLKADKAVEIVVETVPDLEENKEVHFAMPANFIHLRTEHVVKLLLWAAEMPNSAKALVRLLKED